MKKTAILAFITSLFLSFVLLQPVSPANALSLGEQEGFKSGEIPGAFGQGSEPRDPRTIAAELIKFVLTLLGIIFLGLVLFGGFKWMTSAGNSDQVEDAKKMITQAVIGLVIVLSSYGLTIFVFRNLIGATGSSHSVIRNR